MDEDKQKGFTPGLQKKLSLLEKKAELKDKTLEITRNLEKQNIILSDEVKRPSSKMK